MKTSGSSLPLHKLSSDLRSYLFTWIRPRPTAHLGATCKFYYDLCSQDTIWRALFEQEFGRDETTRVAESQEKWYADHRSKDRRQFTVGTYFWRHKYQERKVGRLPFWPANHWASSVSKKDAIKKVVLKPDRLLKILLVGDVNAGKSSICVRWILEMWMGDWVKYDGLLEDAYRKKLTIDSSKIATELSTARRTEQYRALKPLYYRNTNVFLMCFAVDRAESLEHLKTVVDEICAARDQDSPNELPAILVGCKSDSTTGSARVVFAHHVMEFCRRNAYNFPYIECSSKMNWNVDEIFKMAAQLAGAAEFLKAHRDGEAGGHTEKCLLM